MRRSSINRWALAFAIAGLIVVSPAAHAAGFGIFEQGTKAMGMAGAFTAQADDPSAMFHNAGGLAFQKERDFAAGFTYIRSLDATLEGADPFPGEGYEAEQETLSEFPPHLYWVEPISQNVTFGLGVNAPFGLTTEWDEDFRGRFLSRRASLTAVDINPTLGFQLGNLGVGIGGIARVSSVELERNISQFNPFTQLQADIAVLEADGDLDNEGFGWNVGILHKYNNSFSWGLSYRSQIDVDYEGDARVSQNLTGTPFDALVQQALPLDGDFGIDTTISFPDMASLGLAFALGPNTVLETDVNWTGWSSFDELRIGFPGGELPSEVIPQEYEDVYNYRLGLAWNTAPGRQWRFGAVYDETPQPEGGVSPLLPDSDRTGFTVGYGHEGNKYTFDFALMYLIFDERTRDENLPGEPSTSTFFGTYEQEAVLVGLTLGF